MRSDPGGRVSYFGIQGKGHVLSFQAHVETYPLDGGPVGSRRLMTPRLLFFSTLSQLSVP